MGIPHYSVKQKKKKKARLSSLIGRPVIFCTSKSKLV